MNAKKLIIAELQARAFLDAVKDMRADEYSMRFLTGTKASATVRRKSMDLTRALAELRRPL